METSNKTDSLDSSDIKPEVFNTGIIADLNNPISKAISDAITNNPDERIPYSTFMDICLYSPNGYYSSGKVKFGSASESGDFTTSSDISSYFGSAICTHMQRIWEGSQRPQNFKIIEMGAGKGNLANSILDWAKNYYPEFFESIQYKIVEISPALIRSQQESLRSFSHSQRRDINSTSKVEWVNASVLNLPFDQVEGIYISNELPDAFGVELVKLSADGTPVQKFIKLVNSTFVEVWEKPSLEVQEYLSKYKLNLGDNFDTPINLSAQKWQNAMGSSLKSGAIITIDYGGLNYVGSPDQNTVRFFNKELIDPTLNKGSDIEQRILSYKHMGDIDMTASINFEVLEATALAHGLSIEFSGTQADFILLTGITKELSKAKILEHIQYIRDNGSYEDLNAYVTNVVNFQRIISKQQNNFNIRNFGGFYAHILTKGTFNLPLIDENNKQFISQKNIDFIPLLPYLPFDLSAAVSLDSLEGYGTNTDKRVILESSSMGQGEDITFNIDPKELSIRVDQLSNFRIYEQTTEGPALNIQDYIPIRGKLILDSSNPADLEKIKRILGFKL